MPIPKLWVIGLAILAAVIVGLVGVLAVDPPRPLIVQAGFTLQRITPNADSIEDVTEFHYTLSQAAIVTLAFESQNGEQFIFRDQKRRGAGDYQMVFSGVVDGFQREGESWEGTLETRLLPDGIYTWKLTAVSDDGETATKTGDLEIINGDTELPLITAFEVGPTIFTPNQDGIRDRISVNVYLAKPADLKVYLQDQQGVQIFLSERQGGREIGDMGNHEFDYDGGVDQGFRPPADGEYTLFAVAQDAEGQRMIRTRQITIQDSGLPQVEIVPQATGSTVCFEVAPYQESYYSDREALGETIPKPETVCSELTTLTIPVGELLVFHLTVSNYGDTPIRTAGPFPGTVYHQDQRASTLGEYEESGAWRVGIMCDTAESDYPWRWALAPLDELTQVYDPERDETYFYLEPGQRAESWGAIRMTELIEARNPQPCWAGLIHEDVGIPALQNNVGRREVELVPVE
jgi:hypothetical protein